MTILVDADACPVVGITEKIAKKNEIPVILLCDTNHALTSDYSSVHIVSAGPDAVDYALVNICKKGDIVITQDYGVAAMALSRGAFCLHQNGKRYTEENITGLLMEQHVHKEARRASAKNHLKGPSRRTAEEDERFAAVLCALICEVRGCVPEEP